jgi:hypothetical protein
MTVEGWVYNQRHFNMNERKWLVIFAGLIALSIAYYFAIFLPGQTRLENERRSQTQLFFIECFAKAGAAEDKYIEMNGGEVSADGTKLTATDALRAEARRIRLDDEKRCEQLYPATHR